MNALDLSFVKQRLNKTTVGRPGAAGSYSPFGDFDAGGRINALDLAAVKQRLNIQLPPPPPAAPASLFADRRIDDATPLSATSMLLA